MLKVSDNEYESFHHISPGGQWHYPMGSIHDEDKDDDNRGILCFDKMQVSDNNYESVHQLCRPRQWEEEGISFSFETYETWVFKKLFRLIHIIRNYFPSKIGKD